MQVIECLALSSRKQKYLRNLASVSGLKYVASHDKESKEQIGFTYYKTDLETSVS